MAAYVVRVGLWGQIGRFAAEDGRRYPRDTRVVCRTARGLEVGRVLTSWHNGGEETEAGEGDGRLLRAVTAEDERLQARLEQRREQAYTACRALLHARGETAVLVDVEYLFDGRSLYCYLLGEPTPRLDALTGELADACAARVVFSPYAGASLEGCGSSEAAAHGCARSGRCAGCLP